MVAGCSHRVGRQCYQSGTLILRICVPPVFYVLYLASEQKQPIFIIYRAKSFQTTKQCLNNFLGYQSSSIFFEH